MKHRKLRIAWSVAWGIAAVLLVVLWVRSYRSFDRISGRLGKRASMIFVSYAGAVSVVNMQGTLLRWKWPQWDSGPILPHNETFDQVKQHQDTFSWSETDVEWPERTIVGFGRIKRALYLNIPNGERGWNPKGMTGRSYGAGASGVRAPYWFLALVAMMSGGAAWLRFRFSLRTLLIATTLIAVGLGLIVWAANR